LLTLNKDEVPDFYESDKEMSEKIAITTLTNDGLQSALDPRFGRAAFFLIVDTDTGEIIEEISNQSAAAAHGAGTGSSALMMTKEVKGVISGSFGPKAFEALKQMNIKMWSAPEGITAQKALESLKQGTLESVELKVY
jgi:predicted Fe-Mo cluster-binding NifX family protein